MKPFEPLQGPARFAIVMLGLLCVLHAASIVCLAMQIDLLARMEVGNYEEAELGPNDSRIMFLNVATIAGSLGGAVAFVRWFRRAYENLEVFGHKPQHATSGAVWSWFVPIVSLVRPFQIAREIWWASATASGDEYLSPGSAPPLMNAWWGFWITSNVLGQIAFRMASNSDPSISELTVSSWASIASDAASVIAAPLAILVVQRMTARQLRRSQQATGESIASVFE